MHDATIKSSLGSLLGQAARLMGNQLTANFERAGYAITVEQWIVLVNLWENDGATQQELADKGYKHKATVTSLINNLEKNGFVTRIEHPTDRRSNQIRLTERAWALQSPLTDIARQTMQEATQRISPADLDACRRVLLLLISNLLN